LTCITSVQQSQVVGDSSVEIDARDRRRRVKSLRMIQHILAMFGTGCAVTTAAFLVLCWRAAEAPYND
jgi:hypothetical protein